MRKKLNLMAVLCLFVALMFQSASHAQKPVGGSIYLYNQVIGINKDGNQVNVPILFSLFKNGELVRSTELNTTGMGTNPVEATWSDLPVGGYELQCEALGFGKLIRKIAVAPNEKSSFTPKTLPAKDEVQGAGPTLFEIQRKIALLEKQNADLQARLAALEKAK